MTGHVRLAFVVTVAAFPLIEPVALPILGVVKTGDVALAIPPVPVEVAPQRVSTIAPTVVSSRTVLDAAVIVAVCGTPVEAVVLPMNWSCARLSIFARVTAAVAIVKAFVLFAEPLKVEPALVTSPVAVPIVRAVVRIGAETIVITGVVVVVATVAFASAEVTEVTVPLPPLPVLAAVIRPFAFTVTLAFVKEPTLEFTVARVRAVAPVASPE